MNGSPLHQYRQPPQDFERDTSEDDEYDVNNNLPHLQPVQTIPLQAWTHTSQNHLLVSPNEQSYNFKRYFARSTLNTLGPLLVAAFYTYIVYEHLLKPEVHDVIPSRTIGARVVFYAWFLLSIFLLEWAKSGLAGFEAAALMKPKLAPANAMQLMWHADRAWGNLSGWWRLLCTIYDYLLKKLTRRGHAVHWEGPGILWCYLSLSSILFFIAIPLSGLSTDIRDTFKIGNRPVSILGINQTTFDVQSNVAVQTLASNNWRAGNPTSPLQPTIFYAPHGTQNTSSTFYEDSIQNIYQHDLLNQLVSDRNISFFSGPRVAERVHGNAWGMQNSVSCSAVHPQHGLKLIDNVTSIDVWNTSLSVSSGVYAEYTAYDSVGLDPVLFFSQVSYGIQYRYIIASDRDITGVGNGDYVNATKLPIEGAFEMVMWQSVQPAFAKDETLEGMRTNPLVMSSMSTSDNITYLGYGVRCTVTSDVGTADLDAVEQTYSNFQRQAAETGGPNLNVIGLQLPIYEYPGIFAIQSIVFGALSTVTMGYMGPPACSPTADVSCDVFYNANLATKGIPVLTLLNSAKGAQTLQMPVIGPERMTLATYKIFGEAAAAMMQTGPSNWTGTLLGLEPASNLVPGLIPWQLILVLLYTWVAITVIPQLWTFSEKRWSSTLEGFSLFRFGAEFREIVQQLRSNEFYENNVLRDIPGMVGDMVPNEQRGFIGLSRTPASPDKSYVNNRAAAARS